MSVVITGAEIVGHGYKAQLLAEGRERGLSENRIQVLQQKYDSFRERVEPFDIVIALGSARFHVPSPEGEEFANIFFEMNVDEKRAAGTGHGACGWMLKVAEAQVRGWKGDKERAFAAPIVGVPLLFQGPSTEKPFRLTDHFPELEWLKNREDRRRAVICSPPHLSLRTRTPCLFGHKRIRAQFFFEGGFGTTEEFSTGGIDYQLCDGIASSFNNALYRPLRIFVDRCRIIHRKKIWFYQGLVDHLNNMVLFGDVDRPSVEDIRVLRIEEGDDEILDSGVEIRHFKSPLQAAEYANTLVVENKER